MGPRPEGVLQAKATGEPWFWRLTLIILTFYSNNNSEFLLQIRTQSQATATVTLKFLSFVFK
jgi:hypothetical protein